jgi:hypothetical protein
MSKEERESEWKETDRSANPPTEWYGSPFLDDQRQNQRISQLIGISQEIKNTLKFHHLKLQQIILRPIPIHLQRNKPPVRGNEIR